MNRVFLMSGLTSSKIVSQDLTLSLDCVRIIPA